MRQNVYSAEFYCQRCKGPALINLYSDDPDFVINDRVKKQVDYWGKHYYWVHNHQICAICGKLVVGGRGELNLIPIEMMAGEINQLYAEWDPYPERGLLTVHEACSKVMFAEVK